MIVIYKFLALLIYPEGISLALMTAGLFALFFRFRKAALGFIGSALFILTVCSMPIVANYLMLNLEERYPALEHYPKQNLVLLGGCTVQPMAPRIHPEISDAGDRLFETARIYHNGEAPRIITTGGKSATMKIDVMREAAINSWFLTTFMSVPDSAIIKESEALNTFQNATNIKKIFVQNGWPLTITLVTSGWHMPRSVMIFEHQGFTVTPAPCDFYGTRVLCSGIFDYFPSHDALKGTSTAIHEWYGIMGYKLAGWL